MRVLTVFKRAVQFLANKFLFISLFSALMLAACGGGSTGDGAGEETDAGPLLTGIVAIGDSIGNGFGIATPWPTLVQNSVGVSVSNTSVTGEETPFGVSVIQGLLNNNDPSHVLILLGTNDAIRGSVNGAIANLQAMVDIANANDVIAVVGTIPPIPANSLYNERAAQISNGIRGLSGARIAEVRGNLGDGMGLFPDGIHPNTTGQQIIADSFLAVIP